MKEREMKYGIATNPTIAVAVSTQTDA